MVTDGIIRSGTRTPVQTVVLAEHKELRSKNDGTLIAHVVGPVFANLGPNVEDIVIHAYLHSKSTNGQYRVLFARSYDGQDWPDTPSELIDHNSTEGYTISTAYTDREKLGLYLRFLLEVSAATGSVQENCVVSVTAAIRYIS